MAISIGSKAVLAALLVAGSTLDAQQRLPSEPAAAPTPSALDAGFATWRAPRTTRVDPLTLGAPGVHIAILPLSAQPAAARAEGIRALVSACAAAHGHSGASAATAEAENPWAAFEAATAAVPSLVITLVPVPERTPSCTGAVGPTSSLGDGVLSLPADATISSGIFDLEVQVNKFPILPMVVGTAPTRILRGETLVDGPRQARAYYAIDKFAPRADGTFPTVEIRLLLEGSSDALLVVVPDSLLSRIWAAQLPWRAARLAERSATPLLPMPVVRDAELRRARGLLLAGTRDSALSIAIARVSGRQSLSDDDRTVGRVWAGLEAAQAGDTTTARALLGPALMSARCLTLPSSASNDAAQWIENVRPEGSCEFRPFGRALAAGLVPGRTQWTHPEPKTWLGRALLGVTATTLALGVYNRSRATALYSDYQSEVLDPGGVYALAEEHRASANAMLMTAGVTWAGSALIGAVLEWRRATRITGERDFGAKATGRFGPIENPANNGGR